jgi:DNA-3-methyladenine glycosylase
MDTERKREISAGTRPRVRQKTPRPPWKKVGRAFYLRPTLHVARDLPGKLLLRRIGRTLLAGRIVEVEAYLGERDPASHAYRGMTPRNEVMFREGGHLYVYFTYGMHFCCNVVTERKGVGRAVLLRAVEPLGGLALMAQNRGRTPGSGKNRNGRHGLTELCSGPGKLCQAFGIGRKENGTDLCNGAIWIAEEVGGAPLQIRRSTRVGVSAGAEHRWRFYAAGSRYVSRGKPGV